MQQVLVILLFLSAIAYLIFYFYRSSSSRSDCAKGCGSCSTIDIKKIEEQMKAKN